MPGGPGSQSLIEFVAEQLESAPGIRREWLYPCIEHFRSGSLISPTTLNYVSSLFPGQMSRLPCAFVLVPMRKIVSICWSKQELTETIKQWVVRHALEIGRRHRSMRARFRKVEGWLRESDIHPSYVDVMMEEIDRNYLRPCTNMMLIERTNFTEMYRRFRGTGGQFFNLPTLLTLYIMAHRMEVGDLQVKSAISDGVESCKRKKLLLESVVEMLRPFGMELEDQAQVCLLRSSLNLVPMSYCIYNAHVIQPPRGDCSSSSSSWKAVERFVSSLLFGTSFAQNQHFGEGVIRNVLEDEHDRLGSMDSTMAPWLQWSTDNHRLISAPWMRSLVRESMLVLHRNGIGGDLAAHVLKFVFLIEA